MSQGKITEKQKEILEFIKETILSKGYPPAVREICEAVHLKSTSSVHSHLETLERNGYIRRCLLYTSLLTITMETFGTEHKKQILQALEDAGYAPSAERTSRIYM